MCTVTRPRKWQCKTEQQVGHIDKTHHFVLTTTHDISETDIEIEAMLTITT